MKVANPIYDVVFKYILTNNNKVARLIISSLINKEVIELTFNPAELFANRKAEKATIGPKESHTVLRLDFAAKIKNKDGSEELILIEMQKAKLISDIMRFRKYLGSQYMNEAHKYEVNGCEYVLPIFPIYFLGHKLEDFKEEVISIKRDLYNGLTNKKINKQSTFVNSLSHDGMIIQIPFVSEKINKYKKNINKHLSELLLLFDQNKHDNNNQHILDLEKADIPKWLKPILRELEKAKEDPDVRDKMQLEDDWLADLEDYERTIEKQQKELEDKDKELEDKDKTIEDKDKTIEDKDKTIEDKDKTIENKNKAIENSAKALDEKNKELEKYKKLLVKFKQ